jgi:hypothetical protein
LSEEEGKEQDGLLLEERVLAQFGSPTEKAEILIR